MSAGQVLQLGPVDAGNGLRGYMSVCGGIDVPLYLGSRSTFPAGGFGGYQVRLPALFDLVCRLDGMNAHFLACLQSLLHLN